MLNISIEYIQENIVIFFNLGKVEINIIIIYNIHGVISPPRYKILHGLLSVNSFVNICT